MRDRTALKFETVPPPLELVAEDLWLYVFHRRIHGQLKRPEEIEAMWAHLRALPSLPRLTPLGSKVSTGSILLTLEHKDMDCRLPLSTWPAVLEKFRGRALSLRSVIVYGLRKGQTGRRPQKLATVNVATRACLEEAKLFLPGCILARYILTKNY